MSSQQSDSTGVLPSAQVVGNVFVQQFFHILHQSPEVVHRFYQESSKLGRPGVKGEMSTVSTLHDIDEKIKSMNYNEYRVQIKTVDAQESLGGGVIVLVTGYLIGKDNMKKEFTQTFYLATQDNGFYVLNDIFRFVEDADQPPQEEQEFNFEAGSPDVTEHDRLSSDEENITAQTAAASEVDELNEEEIYNPSEHESSADKDAEPAEEAINEVRVEAVINEVPVEVVVKEVPLDEVINEVQAGSVAVVTDSGLSTVQEQKKSYASIVKVMKENITPIPTPTLAPARVAAVNIDKQVKVMRDKSALLSVPTSAPLRMTSVTIDREVVVTPQVLPSASETTAAFSNVAENSYVQDCEGDGYSIYIKNLPLSATTAQLEEEFKKFGTIKPNGIQVRSNKQQGFCYGFVEFETFSALQSAKEASPVMIGNRQVFIEAKRTTTSRGNINNRGRYLPGRGGGFRGDGMRNRGAYGGGRNYGRGDYNYRSDYGNRGGGRSGGQGDSAYHYERRSCPESPASHNSVMARVPASA